jgi:hypothetical protein
MAPGSAPDPEPTFRIDVVLDAVLIRREAMSTRMDALIDEAIAESFPASDAPFFMAAAAVLGAPSRAGVVRAPASQEPSSGSRDSSDRFERTRERAYFLWENEGRPEGRAEDHWRAAERELATRHSGAPSRPKE